MSSNADRNIKGVLSRTASLRDKFLTGFIFLIIVFLGETCVFPDIIYLDKGTHLYGEIIKRKRSSSMVKVKLGRDNKNYIFLKPEEILWIKKTKTSLYESELLSYYHKLKKKSSDSAEAHYQLGLFCLNYELLAQARLEFKKAEELDFELKKIDERLNDIVIIEKFKKIQNLYNKEIYNKSIFYLKDLIKSDKNRVVYCRAEELLSRSIEKRDKKEKDALLNIEVKIPSKIKKPARRPERPGYKNWYKVYLPDEFSASAASDKAIRGLGNSINKAEKVIEAAFSYLNLDSLIEVLIKARRRGVAVRLVLDKRSAGASVVDRLVKAGINVVLFSNRKAIMTNNFCVIDRKKVLVGSVKLGEFNALVDDMGIIEMDSLYLAENYLFKFERLCNFQKNKRKVKNPYRFSPVLSRKDGYQIENYFSPDADLKKIILETINIAVESVYFALHDFEDREIAQALIDCSKGGKKRKRKKGKKEEEIVKRKLRVKGVLEKQEIDKKSQYKRLIKNRITVFKDKNSGVMRHNFFVLDQTAVILSSVDMSRKDLINEGNILIFYDKILAEFFIKEFKRLCSKK
jgi:hypothetical protein